MSQQPNKDPFAAFNVVHSNTETNVATASTADLQSELEKRKLENVFPLEVFHQDIRPMLQMLVKDYDLHRSFVGISLLSAYSTAIGTSYTLQTQMGNICLALWSCMYGMTSSGKSIAMDNVLFPLQDLQKEFNQQWNDDTDGKTDWERMGTNMPTVIYRDAYIPTLMKSVAPDNPKGLLKEADEIMEWINGMDPMAKREGTDQQFWLSGWNGREYSMVRSGKVKISIPRVFVGVLGGIQPDIAYKLFEKDRDVTGFVFRLLFAVDDRMRMAMPDPSAEIPPELKAMHKRIILKLYNDLPMADHYADQRFCHLSVPAAKLHYDWKVRRANIINTQLPPEKRNVHAGILGKMAEYAYRFAAILHITDIAYSGEAFKWQELIQPATMERALKLADYFYDSAAHVYFSVKTQRTGDELVLRVKAMLNARYSHQQIGDALYNTPKPDTKNAQAARRKRAGRLIKDLMAKYPKIMGIKEM